MHIINRVTEKTHASGRITVSPVETTVYTLLLIHGHVGSKSNIEVSNVMRKEIG